MIFIQIFLLTMYQILQFQIYMMFPILFVFLFCYTPKHLFEYYEIALPWKYWQLQNKIIQERTEEIEMLEKEEAE